MKQIKHIISLLLIALQGISLIAQSGPSICDALSILGPHYQGEYGKWYDKKGQVIIESIFSGINAAHHIQRKKSDGYLNKPNPNKWPYVDIPVVPPDGEVAIQLGTTNDGREWERLRTSFWVEPNNTLLLVKFAVVMEDPGHQIIQQPKFEFKALGPDGKPLPCGTYNVVAGGNIPGFQSQGKVVFRDWTTAALDLRSYLGQQITIEFTTYDCSEGEHFAMALFSLECLRSEITTAKHYCPGMDNTITLKAPPGFANYQWSTGQTGEVITIPNPKAGQKYMVQFQPFSSLSNDCTIEMEYTVPNAEMLPPTDTAGFCTGGQALITAPSLYTNSTYLWSNGQATQSIQVDQPGNYNVTVTYEACPQTATLTVIEHPLPHAGITLSENPDCSGRTNGAICADLIQADQNVLFSWSNGVQALCIGDLEAGTYTLTTSNTQTGCTAILSQTLFDPPPLNAQLVTVRTPDCDDDPIGIIEAQTTGGTPPYLVNWSHGLQGEKVIITNGGSYQATITDANQCAVVSSLDVTEMLVSEQHRDIYCFQNNDGWIEVAVSGGIAPYQTELYPLNIVNKLFFDSLYSDNYKVYIKDNTGCVKILPIEITEQRTEPFRITLQSDTVNLGEEILQIPIYNFPVKMYHWKAPGVFDICDDCRELMGRAAFTGPFWHFATDAYGCPDSAMAFLTVTKNLFFYAPNVFCPDAANLENSNFRVYLDERQLANVELMHLSIFDRSGGMVFYAENCLSNTSTAQWDGEVRGKPANPGTYVWVAEVRFLNGEVVLYKGDVTVFYCK